MPVFVKEEQEFWQERQGEGEAKPGEECRKIQYLKQNYMKKIINIYISYASMPSLAFFLKLITEHNAELVAYA